MATRTDIIVVLIGLFLGYYLVSRFFGRLHGRQATDRPVASSAWESKAANGSAQGRDSTSRTPRSEVPWYTVLQVSPSATFDEIRQAYRVRIAEYHPDKTSRLGRELRELAEIKTKQINAAYSDAMRDRPTG